MFQIMLVGFLPTDNGRSCEHHPFGYINALVLECESHRIGLQIQLRMVDRNNLTDTNISSMDLMVAMCALQLENMPSELVVSS